jgi:hypothetical protein
MAQLAVTVAGMLGGAAIGNYYGNAALGAQLGAAAGALAGAGLSWLLSPSAGKPQVNDLRVQVSTYGKMIPVPYATMRISGNVIWSTPLVAHKKSVDAGGGKGLSSSATNYTYSVSFAVSLCEGPIAAIGRVWADGKLLIDYRAGAVNTPANLRGCYIDIQPGTADQMPNPFIQSAVGAGYTPAYRDTAYIVIVGLQLADFANRIPNVTVEVMIEASAGSSALTITGPNVLSPWMMQIDQQRGWVYNVDAGCITKIDPVTNAIAMTASGLGLGGSDLGEGPWCIGSDGYLYAVDAPGWFEQLDRIDPTSLQIVDTVGTTSVDPTTGSFPPISCLMASGDGFLAGCGRWSILGSGSIVLFSEPSSTFGLATWTIDTTDSPDGYDWCCFDDQGYLWATFGDSDGHFTLYKFNLSITNESQSIFCQITNQAFSTGLSYLAGPAAGGITGTVTGGAVFGVEFVAQMLLSGMTVSLNLVETYDLSSDFSGGHSNSGVAFVPQDGTLLLGYGTQLIKFDPASGTVVSSAPLQASNIVGSDGGGASSWAKGVDNGLFVAAWQVFDVIGWVIEETIDPSSLGVPGDQCVYDSSSGAIWTAGWSGTDHTAYKVNFGRVTAGTVPLSAVVSDLCQRGGLTEDQIDVDALAEIPVAGYVASRQGTIREWLAPLMTAYAFDLVEIDYMLTAVLRGGAPIAALPMGDVGAYQGGQTRPDPLQVTLSQEEELPVRAAVTYVDASIDYQANTQLAKRTQYDTIFSALNEISIELPINLTAAQAAQIAFRELYLASIAREFAFATSRKWLSLAPADVITVEVTYADTGQTATFIIRLTQEDLGANGVITRQGVAEDPGLYVPLLAAPGSGPIGVPIMPNLPVSPSVVYFIDSPALRDSDAGSAGFYLAAAPLKEALPWNGCTVMKSLDGGSSFQNFEVVEEPSAVGVAISALPAPRAWTTWDRVNSLTVMMSAGGENLASTSEIAVLNGANVAMLGNEIIQFATVTQNDDGTYTLSDLLRGRRGSDPFVATHAAGDRFIVLSTASTLDVSEDNSQIGLARVYQALSIGESGYPDSTINFTDTARRLMPLTACSIQGARDGSGNLTVTWLRQTRIGGENDWADGVADVPLGEASESYQIDILKAGAVVRTIAVASESAAYAAADQTTDFGSPQSAIDAVIYQMSAVVGRGFGEAATV